MKKILITLVLILITNQIIAQNYKFGKVSKEELEEKYYPLDSSANASILYKKRRTYYKYNGAQGWSLMTKIHERVKIYNKEGYDWATKKIKLYKNNKSEKASIKAYTHNLVDGKIEKIKLKSSEIFDENINKYWDNKKFTMPKISKGTIVEWEYLITSPFYSNIEDMLFQYEIPVKHIDMEVKIPEYFEFKHLPSTYYPIVLNESSENRNISFVYSSVDKDVMSSRGGARVKQTSHSVDVNLKEKIYSSVEKNIPALKDEVYTNNINNYRSKVSFEISAYKPKYKNPKFYNKSWGDVTKTIYDNENFGIQLNKFSHYKDDLVNVVSAGAPLQQKIGSVFQFVKNKIKWDGYSSKYTTGGVRKAYKDGVGNAAEINLTLVSMLKGIGVKANPILISTRDNGVPLFPTTDGFNFVIAGVEIEGEIILLDATEMYSSPNVLPLRDLNWQGRLVREDGSSIWVNLMPKTHSTINETMNVTIDNAGLVEGLNRVVYNDLSSLKYRIKYASISDEGISSKLEENKGIEIINFKLANKVDISKPIVEMYKFSSEEIIDVIGDKIYFNPLLLNTLKTNPFNLEKREFPIDFGTPFLNKYRLNIAVPEGYDIESIPENFSIALSNNYGVYKFTISVLNNKINIYSLLQINTAIYPSLNYNEIKEFFKLIVAKNLERVVLKKD